MDVKVYKTVYAEVCETRQYKEAKVAGFMEITDLRSGEIMKYTPLSDCTVFENIYTEYSGDCRALSSTISGSSCFFPADDGMLCDALSDLKYTFLRVARRNGRKY